jgi:hypothetical protein
MSIWTKRRKWKRSRENGRTKRFEEPSDIGCIGVILVLLLIILCERC